MFYLVIKSRGGEMGGHVSLMEEMGYAHKRLVGKPEGKKQFGISMGRWEDNTEMDPKYIS
jgi:hypothetical protein